MHPSHQHASIYEIERLLAPFERPLLLKITFHEGAVGGKVSQVEDVTFRWWQDIDTGDGAGGVGEGEGARPDAGATA